MSKAGVITIDHVEVSKGDLEKVKKVLKIKDNAEAIKKALDVVVGKINVTGDKEKPKPANDLSDIDEIAVETGISDLAAHHDHYLYGAPKK